MGLTCIAKPEIVDTPYDNLQNLPGHPEFREGEHWRKWDLDADQIVFGGGETGSEIYVVLSGTLMVCTDVRLDATQHLQPGICELFDGEGFAQSCFSDDQPHCATVKTLTSCELAAIDAARLRALLDRRPEIGSRILTQWIHIPSRCCAKARNGSHPYLAGGSRPTRSMGISSEGRG